MSSSIAFFDFDGTLTTKDTLLEFIKYSSGKRRFLKGLLLNSPYLVAYKLKIISNQKAKEKVLSFFFKNMPLIDFNNTCYKFSQEILPHLLRPAGLQEITKLKAKGVKVVIVSASPINWLHYWADSLQLDIIATSLKIENDCITGKIDGYNCHGNEKVRRIQNVYNLSSYTMIYAYGDTSGDKPMLSLAHKSYMRPFRSNR